MLFFSFRTFAGPILWRCPLKIIKQFIFCFFWKIFFYKNNSRETGKMQETMLKWTRSCWTRDSEDLICLFLRPNLAVFWPKCFTLPWGGVPSPCTDSICRAKPKVTVLINGHFSGHFTFYKNKLFFEKNCFLPLQSSIGVFSHLWVSKIIFKTFLAKWE